jgi:hypothetical protein
MIIKERLSKTAVITSASIIFAISFVTAVSMTTHAAAAAKNLDPGSTWVVNETTKLSSLTIPNGANITAPKGYRVTMIVNGVETGQVLETWPGVDYKFAPGTYKGDIVLTVTEANDVSRESGGGGTGAGKAAAYPFRQALYLDKDGINDGKSVLAAVQGEKPAGFDIKNINIKSKGTFYKNPASLGGTGFNGIYAAGGSYNLENIKINFFGDGRSDFVGFGTAVVASGKGTRLVLDNATINTQGIVRSGVIATGGSSLIVKNSKIQVKNGVLPPDYVNTMDTSQMRSSLWISGIQGTTRATSLLGVGTLAAYINSNISFEGWGGLSTDGARESKLIAINCKINNTGKSGYGQYNNSNVVTKILGCEFNVASVGSAADSGSVYLGDSTREAVEALDKELGLGLTSEELKSIPVKHTVINSGFQGVLWHGTGCALTISGGTVIKSKDTVFIDKSAYTDIQVDGSQGARLNAGNGVIMQVMDDDEPTYNWQTGVWVDFYEDPTGPVAKDDSHDIYSAKGTDALAKFSNIELKGNFYNSARGGQKKSPMGEGTTDVSKNLGLTFDKANITGVISASNALHFYNGKYYPKIGKNDLIVFNRVINTPSPAVNNGVIVNLTNGSKWTVTGTSYLTTLVLDGSSSVTTRKGASVFMTIDGNKTEIRPGQTYTGAIVVSVK